LKCPSFSEGTAYSCQTLVVIGALACHLQGKAKLNEICKPVVDGFEVRFCKYPDIKIKVLHEELTEWPDQIRAEGERDFKQRIERIKEILPPDRFFWILPRLRPAHASGDILVRVLELAYAKLMLVLDPSSYPEMTAASGKTDPLGVYHHKTFHYDPVRVMHDMTNWPVTSLIANGDATSDLSKSFAEENKKDAKVIESAYAELADLSANPDKYIAVAGSVGISGDSYVFLDAGTLIVPCHAFVIKDVDDKKKTICLLDPYSSNIGLLLEYSDFLQYCNMIAKVIVCD
jgi:hypothetical protein